MMTKNTRREQNALTQKANQARVPIPARLKAWLNNQKTSDHQVYLTQVILSFTWVVSIVVSLLVWVGWIAGVFDAIGPAIAIPVVIGIGAAWWLANLGWWRIAGIVPAVIFYALAVFGTLSYGGVSTLLLFYAITVLLVGMIYEARAQWLWVVMCALTYTLAVRLSSPAIPLESVLSQSITLSAALIGVALLQQVARSEYQSSEQRIHKLFAGSKTPMLMVDPLTRKIEGANQAAFRFYGWEQDDLSARTFDDLVENGADEAPAGKLLQVLADDGRLEMRHYVAGGDASPVEVFCSEYNLDGRRLYILQVHDISQRVRRERELQAVAAVAAALREASDEDQVIDLLLEQLLGLLNAHGAALISSEEISGEPMVVKAVGSGGDFAGRLRQVVLKLTTEQAAAGEPLIYPPRGKAPPVAWLKAESLAGIPFGPGRGWKQAVWVRRAKAFGQEEVHLLNAVVEIAGGSLRRAGLHVETERRLQHLNGLRLVDMAIASSTDIPTTLNILLEQATGQLGVDAADVLLYEADTISLVYAAGRGFLRSIQRPRQRIGRGLAGLVALERRQIHIPRLGQTGHPASDDADHWNREGFATYLGIPLVAKGEVKGVLELFHRKPFSPDPEWLNYVEILAGQAAIALDNATLFQNLEKANLELTLAYDHTLEGWAHALELRDKETEGHSQRVTELTLRLARQMDFSREDFAHLRRGALLHDIGKMGIPDEILQKPGSLSDAEWEIMRQHPIYARELLLPIAYLQPALDIPYFHHERWDGSGYPLGLQGNAIPLPARMFAVVDVWDALRSERPYRGAWPENKVRSYLRENGGVLFDPQVVRTFLSILGTGPLSK